MQSDDGLTVRYEPDGIGGVARLDVSASVVPFAGAAVGYFADADVRAWTAALRAYPLPPEARPSIRAALGDQETVSMTAYTITRRGQLGMRVYLAVIDIDEHSATHGEVSETTLLVPTGYQALATFADDLDRALDAGGGTAYLGVERLA